MISGPFALDPPRPPGSPWEGQQIPPLARVWGAPAAAVGCFSWGGPFWALPSLPTNSICGRVPRRCSGCPVSVAMLVGGRVHNEEPKGSVALELKVDRLLGTEVIEPATGKTSGDQLHPPKTGISVGGFHAFRGLPLAWERNGSFPQVEGEEPREKESYHIWAACPCFMPPKKR